MECGLKKNRAFWLLHHENKSGQISGDWGWRPDTKVYLQRDGNKPRTKLDWAKTRWATLESNEKTVILEWMTESQGYSVMEMDAVVTDSELDDRIEEFLIDNPYSSTTSAREKVSGNNTRIAKRLDECDRFDAIPGARNARLWFVRDVATRSTPEERVGTSAD